MKAEIISIGTELLLGEITDTNASFLASQLPLLGIDLYFISTVGDNQRRLVNTLRRAWERSDVIITTGGLGPTQDDITREAIAELLNEELRIDMALAQELKSFFARRGLEMPPSNIKQALVIPSAQIIPNPRGIAPGWWVEKEERTIIAMPGPPGEMQLMWDKEVFPKLQQKSEAIILSRTVKTFSLPEAKVDELVSPFLSAIDPTLATYAKPDGIHLRITTKAREIGEAKEKLDRREADIRAILKDYIWGVDSETLEAIIGNLLVTKKLSLATMEFGTGGFLANLITNVPGSSVYFKGGLVIPSSEVAVAFGIDDQLLAQYGVISPEVTEAMATVARRKFEAAIGVAISGVMELGETESLPVGTIFISIDDSRNEKNFAQSYLGPLLHLKRRAAFSALFELRKLLLEGGFNASNY